VLVPNTVYAMGNREYLIDVLILYSIAIESKLMYNIQRNNCDGDGILWVKYTLLNEDHENTNNYYCQVNNIWSIG